MHLLFRHSNFCNFTCVIHTKSCFVHCFVVLVDNAYWLLTFQGHLLQKNNKDRFCQLLWRPCPPSLLFTQSRANTGNKKDLKKYSKIFEQKDRLSHSKASKELVDKRRLMMEEYRRYRDNAIQLYNQQRDLRLQFIGGVDTDELDSYVEDWEEETIEFFINEEILLLGDMESTESSHREKQCSPTVQRSLRVC